MKYLAYLLAYMSFGIGFLGIFLPLVPTVPLFLLGVYILARVSKRNIVKIKKIPLFGKSVYKIIRSYIRREKKSAKPCEH